MNIEKQLITTNNQGKKGSNHPKYIVIHDTGNTRITAGAQNHCKWLQTNNDTNRSAHIFVDSTRAIQVIEYNTPALHTGVRYVSHPKVSDCTNENSIGVEFCINEDGDLSKTLSNTIEVVAYLMAAFHIPIQNVITHQMSSGKECPGTFIRQPQLYKEFFIKLNEEIHVNDELQVALEYLHQQGITNTPTYWLKKCDEVEHLQGLLLNMYNGLKKAYER